MRQAAADRPNAGQVHDEASLGRFVTELEAVLHDLSVRTALCWWDKYTGGPGQGLNELEKERSEILLDPSYHTLAREWAGAATDPFLGRKIQLLTEAILAARVSAVPEVYSLGNEIMNRVLCFRPVVFGREVSSSERNRILRVEPDRALRREAWIAIAPLSMEVGASTVELLRQRNGLARRAGYDDYVHLSLALASLTRGEVLTIIGDLERASAEAYKAFLTEVAQAEGLDPVEPWDVSYLVEKATAIPTQSFPRGRIVPSLQDFARSFGADPAALGIRIVNQDIPFGGLCLGIDPPADVRILANPQDGHNYFSTLFHEYGHGLHAVLAGANSQLLQEEPGVFGEGMAEVWSWFTYYPKWLKGLGLDDKLARAVTRAQSLRMLVRHRALSADVAWELEAYRDPGQDLTGLAAEAEARYLLVVPRPVHRWAGGPFPSGYPVYRQNYILADLIAGTTHRTLKDNYGDTILGNPRVFEAIAETYWRPGALKPWREKLRAFTGRDLEASAVPYARQKPARKQEETRTHE